MKSKIKDLRTTILNNFFDINNNPIIQWQLIIAIVGGVLLIAGVFSPFINAPFIGTLPYSRIGKYYDEAIIACGVLAILVAIIGLYRWVIVSACGSLCVIIVSLYNVYSRIQKLHDKIEERLYSNPYKDVLISFLNSVQQSISIQWGIILLFSGIVMLIFSSLMEQRYTVIPTGKKSKKSTHENQAIQ
jgi:protein-S-isoprenylcysteine O-methyltransferase Ste14